MKFSVYVAAISLAVAIGVIEVQASPYWSSKNDNNDCEGNYGRGDCQESCHKLMRFSSHNATFEQLCTGNDATMLWKWQNCYRCSCEDGSYLMADGKTCSTASSDNIRCEGNNGLGECHHSCLNLSKLWGSYNASIQQLCTDNDATTLWKQKNCYRCSCEDGFYLMADGKNCKETTCENGYFRCPSDGYCISSDSQCDGEYDCQDKTDEIGCPDATQNCNEKCQNGGQCNAELECECESQWEGEYCHLTVCDPRCKNNGICTADWYCDCPSGWEGAKCDREVPDCNPKCQNGGTCNTDLECECTPGWEGESCHTFVPDCQNGGTYTADSECDCSPGWEGDTCNSATCASLKCSPNGRCTEKEGRNEAFCTCDDGYVSEEKECIATCTALQCSPNGICNDKRGLTAAFCTCNAGYVIERKGCTVECHDGEIIADKCLKFYFERVSWEDAQKRCETQTDHLAILDDPEGFKKHMIDKSNSIESNGSVGSTLKRFWVAASESSDNKDEWSWLGGSPLEDDFPWGSQQRKKHENRKYCLAWDSKNQIFDDKNCDNKIGFICEH